MKAKFEIKSYLGSVLFTYEGWDDIRWNECSGGIHFFLTREEAEAYE